MVGKPVPALTLPSSSGHEVSLSALKGRKIVLYFYPKDDTPGCTIEGHEFSQLLPEFAKHNTVVYGISRDSLDSHGKFINKCGLTVELLSDVDEKLCKAFDVIKEKNMYGKMVMGIERSTFVIDENGTIVKEYRKVTAQGHAQQVLTDVQ